MDAPKQKLEAPNVGPTGGETDTWRDDVDVVLLLWNVSKTKNVFLLLLKFILFLFNCNQVLQVLNKTW